MKLFTKDKNEMSESLLVTFIITLSGGFQDAYTYFCKGGVFANAQTGNIVLMSGNIFSGNLLGALRYLIPVIAFATGVILTEQILNFGKKHSFYWRQVVLICEIVLLSVSGLIPRNLDMLANCIVSFSCAMQVQAFRKVEGYGYASTMCIGNLRSGMEAFSSYIRTHKATQLKKSLRYLFVIFAFAIGAGTGTLISKTAGQYAIFVSCGMLFIALTLILSAKKVVIE